MRLPEQTVLPWSAGAAAALIYLCFPSSFFNFDGVACAIAVDTDDFKHLVHGNHLAYGLVGWAFHRLWAALGYAGQSIYPLQVLDSLLGGATVGVFASWMLRSGASKAAALLAGAGLCLSYAFWFWSLEAQVYPLGAFFLALAAREAWAEKPDPLRLGLWHAGAALGHVGHAMFLPAALYLLWTSPHSRRQGRVLLTYLATLGAVLASAYGAAALFIIRPGDAEHWRVWLLGSAALSADRSFLWHGGYSWEGLHSWAAMSLRLFAYPDAAGGAAAALGWTLAAAAAAAAAASLVGRDRQRRAAQLWLAGYAALFLSWEPFTIVYRITDLLPLWWGLGRAAASAGRRRLLAVLTASLGLYNWTCVTARTDPRNNQPYQKALAVSRLTPENAWICATSIDQVYLPYFGARRPLSLRYFDGRPDALARRLDALAAAGEPVFITEENLLRAEWRAFFESYGVVPTEGSAELYRVRKGKPNGRR